MTEIIDFTNQIKELKANKECGCNPDCGCKETVADEKAGYPPNCNEGYEDIDGKCVEIKGYWDKKKSGQAKEN